MKELLIFVQSLIILGAVVFLTSERVDVIIWEKSPESNTLRADYGKAKLKKSDDGSVYVFAYGRWQYIK